MSKKNWAMLIVLVLIFFKSHAQYATVYPTNWWVGMKHNKIQLLIHGEYDGFSSEKVRMNYPGVTITNV
ncbi:MAG TPA: cyclomaltodextrinase N-terminal domain-containing protein, partial [Panacibacter sp.]|nr:cyclomaltodextrinase N-terminal domain-containing protein [Panacibacter sp.]